MLSRVLPLGGRTVLVTRVNGRQYGHMGLEIAMSLARARELSSDVCFVRPKEVVAEALFEVDTDAVRIRRDLVTGAAARVSWWWDDRRAATAATRRLWAQASRRELMHHLESKFDAARQGKNKELQFMIKTRIGGLKRGIGAHTVVAEDMPLYYQRRTLRSRVPVHLTARAAAQVRAAAARAGVDLDAPMVTLHVREAGWKSGREMHESKPDARNDSVRNARIETYFDAMQYLVDRGFAVVRIGDPSMTPVRRRGVVDLATAANRSQLLEVDCLMRSAFFISAEAGPVGVSYLTNTPLLTVNATDPVSSYPIRDDGMYILKRIIDRQTGRPLTISELFSESYLRDLRNITRYSYIDNTSDEITQAVAEMLAWVRGDRTESEEQVRFRDMAAERGESLRAALTYVRKWGSDRGFIGDGRFCRFFVAGAE
jgi:putative glycosyltransferase (TIGR04372 family)